MISRQAGLLLHGPVCAGVEASFRGEFGNIAVELCRNQIRSESAEAPRQHTKVMTASHRNECWHRLSCDPYNLDGTTLLSASYLKRYSAMWGIRLNMIQQALLSVTI